MSAFTINGNTFNPRAPAVRTLALEAADSSKSDYIVIQTANDSLSKDDKTALTAKGVEIQEYVGNNTFICGYKPEDLNAVRELPFVKYANVYLSQFVVQPALKTSPASSGPRTMDVLAETPASSRSLRLVDLVLHEDAKPTAELTSAIAAAAHADPESVRFSGNVVQLNVQQDFLQGLADIDAVRYIQEVQAKKLYNNVAREILNADVIINDTEYKGEGQVVAVADTGFDKGSTTDTLPAFADRVKRLYKLGRPNKADDPDGHGTHVCGSVLGDAISDTMGGRIEAPASKATLVMQSTLDAQNGLGGIPRNLEDLFRPPYEDDGARVHVNSWGSAFQGSQLPYDSSSRAIDKFVWENSDMVITFAAGNDAFDGNKDGVVDPRTIGAEAAAKNCITVGATENNRSDIEFSPPPWDPTANAYTYGQYFKRDYPTPPVANDHMADKPDGIAAFSSRGPTVEGRIKPDVAAPGTAILSARSRAMRNADTHYGISRDSAWWFETGTSMANPLVGGCCAVLRETLVKNNVQKPSAALIKALLVNGAKDITGQYKPSEAGPAPNGDEGFGRVDLANSVIIPGSANAGAGDVNALDQDEEWTLDIQIPQKRSELTDQSSPDKVRGASTDLDQPLRLKVTLAYSDPPGAALQNDLNLIVIGSRGRERHGNQGQRLFPTGSLEGFDTKNNVEQIVWDDVPAGKAKIQVRARRITRFAQPFAYAWKIF